MPVGWGCHPKREAQHDGWIRKINFPNTIWSPNRWERQRNVLLQQKIATTGIKLSLCSLASRAVSRKGSSRWTEEKGSCPSVLLAFLPWPRASSQPTRGVTARWCTIWSGIGGSFRKRKSKSFPLSPSFCPWDKTEPVRHGPRQACAGVCLRKEQSWRCDRMKPEIQKS